VLSPLLLAVLILSGGCQPAEKKQNENHAAHLRWVSKSIEYAASCRQVYEMAWPRVKRAAESQIQNWTVVLDVDETVLNNVQYEVERAAVDSGFTPASWSAWVRREEASPIPGVADFLQRVRTLGPLAHVAFITNRRFENEEATTDNLRKLGLFHEGDAVLTKKDDADKKADRRQCLEEGTGRCAEFGPMKIIALFGDNIRDFMQMRGSEKAKAYLEQGLADDDNWGRKYFILPNPIYGSWQRDYK